VNGRAQPLACGMTQGALHDTIRTAAFGGGRLAWQRQRRPKPKLSQNPVLRQAVQAVQAELFVAAPLGPFGEQQARVASGRVQSSV
jgi:hypothetical protein